MMYLIYKNDGSVKTKKLNELIQQGNSYVNIFFVAIEDRLPATYNLIAYFTLPNGMPSQAVSLSGQTGTVEIDGVSYTGRYLSLTSEQTKLNGALKVNIVAQTTELEPQVLVSTTTYLTINEGVEPTDPVLMTASEYQNLIAVIGQNVLRSETIYKVALLADAGGADEWDEGQAIFVLNSTTQKLYEVVNDDYVLRRDFNLPVYYNLGNTLPLTVTDEVYEKLHSGKYGFVKVGNDLYKLNDISFAGVNFTKTTISLALNKVTLTTINIVSTLPLPTVTLSSNDLPLKNYVEIQLTGLQNQINDLKLNAFKVVDTEEYPTLEDFLESEGEEGYLYLYPVNTSDLTKGYYRYVWENDSWLSLGTTEIDLTNYYTKTQVNGLLSDKQDSLTEQQLQNIEDVVNKSTVSGTVGDDGKWNTLTIDGTTHDLGGAGGGTEYTAGNGIDITDNEISIDEEVVATKTDLTEKENTDNKTTSLSASSTDTEYPSAKAVFDGLQDVREVAEGKTATYILSYNETAPTTDTDVLTMVKADGTIIEDLADFNTYVGSSLLANSVFNSSNDYIYPLGYLIVQYGKTGESRNKQVLRSSDLVSFKKGTNIIVVETDVPDRWYNGSGAFYCLETQKVDLTNYVDLSSAQTITGVKTFNDNIIFLRNKGLKGDGPIFIAVGNMVWVFDQNILRPSGNGNSSIGTLTARLKEIYTNSLIGATQSANTDDIINGTFNVINGSDITSYTFTQAQYDLIRNGKPTLIKGATRGGRANTFIFPMYIGGTQMSALTISSNNANSNLYIEQINIYSNKTFEFSTSGLVGLNGINSINGKTVPSYPANNINGQFVYYNNALAWLRNGIVSNTTDTSFTGAFASNLSYEFAEPLTALSITDLEVSANDANPIWSITFKANDGFVLTTDDSLDIHWSESSVSTFETNHLYKIMIKQVSEWGYIGVIADFGGIGG